MKRFGILLVSIWIWGGVGSAQDHLCSFSPGAGVVSKSGIVDVYDPSALYWNPAALGVLNSSQTFLAVHDPFMINLVGYSHFLPLGGSFALNLARTGPEDNAVELGSVGWGNAVYPGIYVGLSLSSYQIQTEGWTGGGLGVLYKPDSRDAGPLPSAWLTDRLTVAAAVQNIPLIVSDYDHQVRVGASYTLVPNVLSILYGRHIQRKDDTCHFSTTLSLFRPLRFRIGWVDWDSRNMAVGAGYIHDNLAVDAAYDTERNRVLVSVSLRVGRDPSTLATEAYENARIFLQNREKRKAFRKVQTALAYDKDHLLARDLKKTLDTLIDAEDRKIDSLLRVGRAFERKQWFISAAAQYLKVLRLHANEEQARDAIERIRPKVNIHTEKWYQQAVRYFERGELSKAMDIFESILFVRQNHPGSKVYLNKIQAIFKQDAQDHYYTGLGFYSQRNLDRAEEEFRQAVDLVPTYTEAIEYLNRLRKERQQNRKQIEQMLARAYRDEQRSDWAGARSVYREIIRLDPYHDEARRAEEQLTARIGSLIQRQMAAGRTAYQSGNYETAKSAFRAVLAVEPQHDEARRYLSMITDQTSGKAQQHMEQARALFERNSWEAALAQLDSARTISSSLDEIDDMREQVIAAIGVEQLYETARNDYYSGNYLQAMEKLNTVFEKDPAHSQAQELREQCQTRLNEQVETHFNRGIQLYSEEKYMSAIHEWEKALEINPYHKGALEYIANATDRLKALDRLP